MIVFILDKDPYYLDYLTQAFKAFPKVIVYPFHEVSSFYQKLLEVSSQKQKHLCILEGELCSDFDVHECLNELQHCLQSRSLDAPEIFHLSLAKPKQYLKNYLETYAKHYRGKYIEPQSLLQNAIHRFSPPFQIYEKLKERLNIEEQKESKAKCFLYIEHPEKENSDIFHSLCPQLMEQEANTPLYCLDFRAIFSFSHFQNHFIVEDSLFQFLTTFHKASHEGSLNRLEHFFQERENQIFYYLFPPEAASHFTHLEFKAWLSDFIKFFAKLQSQEQHWLILLPSYLLGKTEALFPVLHTLILNLPEHPPKKEEAKKKLLPLLATLPKECQILDYQERNTYVTY